MKEIKGYTPGPWTVADYEHALAVECTVNGIKHTVVTDQFCYPNFKQNKDPEKVANAELIAAAPELYEEVTRLREQVNVLREAIKDISTIGPSDIEEIRAKCKEVLSQTEKH